MADCEWWDLYCKAGSALQDAASGAIQEAFDGFAQIMVEAFGRVVASFGSIWLMVPSGAITQGTSSGRLPDAPAAMTAPVNQLLSYISWYSLILTVISLTILGAIMTFKHRNGEAYMTLGKLGIILTSTTVIGAAPMLIRIVLTLARQPLFSSTVQWLQDSLMWVTFAVAIGGLMVAAARMAWQMRAEPGQTALRDIIRLVIVVGAGVPILGILLAAGDAFAKWFFYLATSCDISVSGGACFGENLVGMLNLSGPLGAILLIIFAFIGMFSSMGQILLMLLRNAAVIVLTGTLPSAAAAAMMGQRGQQWWEKSLGWLVAWVLYKPVAAIVYGTAFMLTGQQLEGVDDIVTILTGLGMMILALVALPALIRLVTPLVGSMAAGGAAGGGFAGAMAGSMMPSGAQSVQQLFQSSSSGGGVGGSSDPSAGSGSPSGNNGAGGSGSGASGPGSAGGDSPQGAQSSQGGGAGAGDASSNPSAAPTGNAPTGAGGAGAGATGAGASATGAGAAAGGGAGAGAAAAAGPVGAGIAAAGVAVGAIQNAANQAQQFGEESMGEPSGSNN